MRTIVTHSRGGTRGPCLRSEAAAYFTLRLFSATRDVALEDSRWAHGFLESQQIAHRFDVSQGNGHPLKRHFEFLGEDIFQMHDQQFRTSTVFLTQQKTDVPAEPALVQRTPRGLAAMLSHLQPSLPSNPGRPRTVRPLQPLLSSNEVSLLSLSPGQRSSFSIRPVRF